MYNPSSAEVLSYLVQSGNLDMDVLLKEMEKADIMQKLNDCHKYKIYYSSGRWRTIVKTEDGKSKKISKTHKEDLIDYLCEFYDILPKDEPRTLRELFPKWMELKAARTDAPSYMKKLYSSWSTYYLGTEIIDIPIQDLTLTYLEIWAHELVKNHYLTKKAYYNHTVIVRQILDYACRPEVGLISSNPMDHVKVNSKLFKRVQKKEANTQVFSEDEEKALKQTCLNSYFNGPKSKQTTTSLMVIFLFETGMRSGEVTALKWSDIKDGKIHVQREEVEDYLLNEESKPIPNGFKILPHTKSEAGDRWIPLTSRAWFVLDTVKKHNEDRGWYDDDFIFLNIKTHKRTSTETLSTYIEKACKRSGIPVKRAHKIRKSFISSCIDHNINLDTVRRIVGHEDEKVTLHNYLYDRSDDQEILNQLEKIGEKKPGVTSLKK